MSHLPASYAGFVFERVLGFLGFRVLRFSRQTVKDPSHHEGWWPGSLVSDGVRSQLWTFQSEGPKSPSPRLS